MSDIFDHELDAWEDANQRYEDGDSVGASGNSNYYHAWVNFHDILRETDRAYMVCYIPGINFWVAKKLIRGVSKDKKRFFIHLGSWLNSIKAAVEEARNQLEEL